MRKIVIAVLLGFFACASAAGADEIVGSPGGATLRPLAAQDMPVLEGVSMEEMYQAEYLKLHEERKELHDKLTNWFEKNGQNLTVATQSVDSHEIKPKVEGAVELCDSRRAGWKTRKHFYQVQGVKEYTYKTKDGKLIRSKVHDKEVPDKRTGDKRHPIYSTIGTIGMLLGVGTNACGAINLIF